MGTYIHHAIVVTCDPSQFTKIYAMAYNIFGNLRSTIKTSRYNAYDTFIICPDGSKEETDESDFWDTQRTVFLTIIESFNYEDGSNPITYVEISYGHAYNAKIERTNSKE